jgi:hypothetical protein
MRIPHIDSDPPRDAVIAAALAADGETVQPDWFRLHASIMARAEQPLARLRLRPSWFDYAASWARPAIPFAAAAGFAFAFFVGTVPDPRSAVGAALPFLDDVLAASISDAEYDILIAGEGADALLRLAVQEP